MVLYCLVLAILPKNPHLGRGILKILDRSTVEPLGNRPWPGPWWPFLSQTWYRIQIATSANERSTAWWSRACTAATCVRPMLRFGGNSSSENETWFMANTNDTIPSKEDSVILVGTCVSFYTFNKASRWTAKDSNKAKIEIWARDLFNCWITL